MASLCEVSTLSYSGKLRAAAARRKRRTYSHAPYAFDAVEGTEKSAPVAATATNATGHEVSSEHSSLTQSRSDQPQVVPVGAAVQIVLPDETQLSAIADNEVLRGSVGHFYALAQTAHGSSYLQAVLRESEAALALILPELLPYFAALLPNVHGCYVVKALLERMDTVVALETILLLGQDASLMVQLCNASLHSRRMIQFFLEFCGPQHSLFLYILLLERFFEIVCTQQGCITAQRILDHRTPEERERVFDILRLNLLASSCDPFANYVVQYMFDHGDVLLNSRAVAAHFTGSMVWLSSQKYASNAVEKALEHVSFDLQRALIQEILTAPDDVIFSLLLDSFANYILQAVVRIAPHRDIGLIAQRFLPLLRRVPYGRKMEQRILRRLHGKVSSC
jgi:hypothetical protein